MDFQSFIFTVALPRDLQMFGDQLSSTGLRIIAPDRPGIGLSDFQPSRSLKNWANDVEQLANHLAWPSFALLGNSGGGPYVIACAALIPKRVTVAAVVSGAWRMDAPEVKAALHFVNRIFWIFARSFIPGFRLMLTAMRKSGLSAKTDSAASDLPSANDLKKLRSMLPPPDVAALSVPGRMRATSAAMTEAMRNGTRGVEWDARIYVRPFDFEHTSICVPVRAFHGGLDRNVPLALVSAYTAEIPGATLTVWPDDGHLSAPCNHLLEIVAALKSS